MVLDKFDPKAGFSMVFPYVSSAQPIDATRFYTQDSQIFTL